jgi:hypothetical protein
LRPSAQRKSTKAAVHRPAKKRSFRHTYILHTPRFCCNGDDHADPPRPSVKGGFKATAAGIRRWLPAQHVATLSSDKPPPFAASSKSGRATSSRSGVVLERAIGATALKISATGRVASPNRGAQHSRSVHRGAVPNSPVKGNGHVAKPVPPAIATARKTRVPSRSTSSPSASLLA